VTAARHTVLVAGPFATILLGTSKCARKTIATWSGGRLPFLRGAYVSVDPLLCGMNALAERSSVCPAKLAPIVTGDVQVLTVKAAKQLPECAPVGGDCPRPSLTPSGFMA
jgi:hypothetical protein